MIPAAFSPEKPVYPYKWKARQKPRVIKFVLIMFHFHRCHGYSHFLLALICQVLFYDIKPLTLWFRMIYRVL